MRTVQRQDLELPQEHRRLPEDCGPASADWPLGRNVVWTSPCSGYPSARLNVPNLPFLPCGSRCSVHARIPCLSSWQICILLIIGIYRNGTIPIRKLGLCSLACCILECLWHPIDSPPQYAGTGTACRRQPGPRLYGAGHIRVHRTLRIGNSGTLPNKTDTPTYSHFGKG